MPFLAICDKCCNGNMLGNPEEREARLISGISRGTPLVCGIVCGLFERETEAPDNLSHLPNEEQCVIIFIVRQTRLLPHSRYE